MIDQKPRDPLYPQGFEDIDNLKTVKYHDQNLKKTKIMI